MGDREDYAEPGAPPAWERPAFRRRVYTFALTGLLLIVGGVLIFILLSIRETDRHYTVTLTIHRADVLVRSCQIYRERHPDTIYPATLSDLAQPLPGGGPGPFVDDTNLIDGWGNTFRYALVPNEAGELEPYVWAERTRNGKTTLHGAKLAADGTVVRFGLPED